MPVAGRADTNYLELPPNSAYNPNSTTLWVESGATWVDGNHVGWGTYNEAHVYTISYTGTGGKVAFNIWDTDHSDNTGTLTFKIYGAPEVIKNCTLSQGYWKNHSEDLAWQTLGKNTPFFQSGKTYFEIMSISPAGNSYYQLARQYVAAKLNSLNGSAMPSNVQTAYNQATALFVAYSPDQVAEIKGHREPRNNFIFNAGVLEKYNTGVFSTGKCSEDDGDEHEDKKDKEDKHEVDSSKDEHESSTKDKDITKLEEGHETTSSTVEHKEDSSKDEDKDKTEDKSVSEEVKKVETVKVSE
jgi:hypothetical protein